MHLEYQSRKFDSKIIKNLIGLEKPDFWSDLINILVTCCSYMCYNRG